MTAAKKREYLSIEDYLAGEEVSPIKYEYCDGVVYAMAGARNAHNIIKNNVYYGLRTRLKGQPCQPFDSDTKIRIRLSDSLRFDYPDASLICKTNPQSDSFQDEPVLLFEVLSRSTHRIDEREKKLAYLAIPCLLVYVLLEQEFPFAVVYRRTPRGFEKEEYEGLNAVLPLGEVGIELPLAEVYETVEFSEEGEEEESR